MSGQIGCIRPPWLLAGHASATERLLPVICMIASAAAAAAVVVAASAAATGAAGALGWRSKSSRPLEASR